MWEIIKKIFSFLTAIRQWFADQKNKEVQRLEAESEKDHGEVEQEYEQAKERLEAAGNSSDAFESELDRVRRIQTD